MDTLEKNKKIRNFHFRKATQEKETKEFLKFLLK